MAPKGATRGVSKDEAAAKKKLSANNMRRKAAQHCKSLMSEKMLRDWKKTWNGLNTQGQRGHLHAVLRQLFGTPAFGNDGWWMLGIKGIEGINLFARAAHFEVTGRDRPNITFDELFETKGAREKEPAAIWGDLTMVQWPMKLRSPDYYRKGLHLHPEHAIRELNLEVSGADTMADLDSNEDDQDDGDSAASSRKLNEKLASIPEEREDSCTTETTFSNLGFDEIELYLHDPLINSPAELPLLPLPVIRTSPTKRRRAPPELPEEPTASYVEAACPFTELNAAVNSQWKQNVDDMWLHEELTNLADELLGHLTEHPWWAEPTALDQL
jgi:hypothetical protein